MRPQLIDRVGKMSQAEKQAAEAQLEKDPHFQQTREASDYNATFRPMEFAKVERPCYTAEVGKKNGDYYFHFFPLTKEDGETYADFPSSFEDKMGDAFIKCFKIPERLEQDYVSELTSYAVRARGFASNPMGDQIAVRVFDELDALLAS